MIRTLSALAFATALAACSTAAPPSPLDSLVPPILEKDRIPGAVVLWGDMDGVRYRKAFGSAKLDTIFDLASCTKIVGTTTAVMLLVERGKLSLDDPLGRYVKCFDGRDITVRQLLLHRSRFPAYHTAKSSTPDGILEEFARLPAMQAEYTYS